MGGIVVRDIESVRVVLDGTIIFNDNIDDWPRHSNGKVLHCIHFLNIKNVTFTSTERGVLDGQGSTWWGLPGIGYLVRGENRPNLFKVEDAKDILVENMLFLNAPYWTFWVTGVDGLEVRYCEINAKRTDDDHHGIIDLTAFNTDGFDVSGQNVWIHDCTVWNQDDCIAVKGNSQNMLFERVTASGLGLTIGSIAAETVRNITFRDCYMYRTYKGIYLKFRSLNGPGLIEDITYENIVMDSPEQ